MNGLVLIDKPAGCTSHDIVNRWRWLADTKRAGHLGTLDPMATGLLALVTGTATRLAQFFNRQKKTYECGITLGACSDTYDIEGEVTETSAPIPDASAIRRALNRFRGRILQTPPPVSAKKIKGVPAYKLVRQHIPVELEPVQVEIESLDVRSIAGKQVAIVVKCSAGTYARSIAHDLGRVLGCGALLNSLRRIESGQFRIQEARTVDELAQLASEGQLEQAVIPPGNLLPEFPCEHFESNVEAKIRQGRDFRTSPFVVPPGTPFVKALSRTGDLIAIGQLVVPNLYHPSMVL